MSIEKEKMKQVFLDYVADYNAEDEKIRLKIEHTFRVADIIERIAESLSLSKEEVDLAWAIGLLHDIGRFEQLRIYGTFDDSKSIDHAAFGVMLLFEKGLIREFIRESAEDELIKAAIQYHNVYILPEELDDRTRLFCQLIRDADKIDILRVNVEFSFEAVYGTPMEELIEQEITPEVVESFKEEHAVEHCLKRNTVDRIIGHASLVFELMYEESFRIVAEQKYLWKIFGFESRNPRTREQFGKLEQHMEEFLSGKGIVIEKQ